MNILKISGTKSRISAILGRPIARHEIGEVFTRGGVQFKIEEIWRTDGTDIYTVTIVEHIRGVRT